MTTKKFVAVATFAFALAFAFTAAAASLDFGSSTIKQGSSGMYAKNVQAQLNACGAATPALDVDGHFGAKSVIALKSFQTSKGLTADGHAGALTKAALANCGSTTTTPTTPSTTATCPAGFVCTPTTGGTPVNNSTAPLSINSVTSVSGYLNTQVGVGQVDKPVANIRLVTGAGGSATLSGLNVSFYNFGSGTDYQFTKYASNVGVWLNGVKIGSLDANQFTQYNSVYSAYIPTTSGLLNANSTNNLVISVSALPTIDSANMAGDIWATDVTSLRYNDATGVFTYTPSNVFGNAPLTGSSLPASSNTWFSFASSASAQSIKLTITRNVNDSNDRVITGSASANTNGVQLAMIDLSAQGDAVNLRRLPVSLHTATSSASTVNPSSVVNTLRLYDAAGNQLDSESVPSTPSGDATITFQNLNIAIAANTTSTLTIKGDVNTVGTAFAAGDYATVSVLNDGTGTYSASNDVAGIQAYDSGSNVLSGTSVLTGSSQGTKISVYVNGINVTAYGTPTTTVTPAGGNQNHSTVSYTIPFSVTAFGSVAYLPSTAAAATSASAAQAIQFCIDATTACAAGGNGIVSYLGNDNLTVSGNGNYQLPIGQAKNFQLVITYQPASAISTRAQLLNVNWNAADATTGFTPYTSGLSSNAFKTPYVAAN